MRDNSREKWRRKLCDFPVDSRHSFNTRPSSNSSRSAWHKQRDFFSATASWRMRIYKRSSSLRVLYLWKLHPMWAVFWIRIRIGSGTKWVSGSGLPGRPKLFVKTEKIQKFLISCLKSSVLGWVLLLEPECPLKGFKKIIFDRKFFFGIKQFDLDTDSATACTRNTFLWESAHVGKYCKRIRQRY